MARCFSASALVSQTRRLRGPARRITWADDQYLLAVANRCFQETVSCPTATIARARSMRPTSNRRNCLCSAAGPDSRPNYLSHDRYSCAAPRNAVSRNNYIATAGRSTAFDDSAAIPTISRRCARAFHGTALASAVVPEDFDWGVFATGSSLGERTALFLSRRFS